MPEAQVKRSALVRVIWALLIIALGIGAASIPAGVYFRQELIAFSNTWGNVASLAGLWVGVIGFAITILTLLLTLKIESEAKEKIEEAVREAADAVRTAQTETRQAIRNIGLQLLHGDCESLGRSIFDIRRLAQEAATHGGSYWLRMTEKCREAAYTGKLLLANPHLSEGEKEGLGVGMSKLTDIATFIERNRIPPGAKNNPLSREHIGSLDILFDLLTNILVRLRGTLFEVPHVRT